MKNLNENNKFLQKYINRLHQELRMRLKFHNNPIDEQKLNKMVDQIIHVGDQNPQQGEKENVCINNQVEGNIRHKNREIQYLKKQIQMEAKLTKKFFLLVKKENVSESFLYDDGARRNQSNSSELQTSQTIISSFNTLNTNNLSNKVHSTYSTDQSSNLMALSPPDQENEMLKSMEVKNSMKKDNGRSPRIMTLQQSIDLKQSLNKENDREKSKTFAKLRKLQAMFCSNKNNPPKQDNTMKRIRRKSYATQFYETNTKENEIISQENLNLKAIRNNLVTHLSIMQKYKSVPSIEELVRKEQKIKRRQSELKDLSEYLDKKERKINKTHTEVLRKQKSTKMF